MSALQIILGKTYCSIFIKLIKGMKINYTFFKKDFLSKTLNSSLRRF